MIFRIISLTYRLGAEKMDRHRIPALLAAIGLAVTACSSSEAVSQATDTPSTAMATPSTTRTPTPTARASAMDPFASPPDEGTEAYVQQVLEAIYEVEAEVIRREVAAAAAGATAPPEEAVELLSTIYDGKKYRFALLDLEGDWEGGQFVEGVFAESPAPAIVDVQEVLRATDDCILTTYALDRSPTLQQEREPSVLMALLRPKPREAEGVDRASWVIDDQVVVTSETRGSCD